VVLDDELVGSEWQPVGVVLEVVEAVAKPRA